MSSEKNVDEIKAFVGNKLRLLRTAHQKNQTQIAEILGCSQNEVSAWERGERFISWPCAYKLVEYFKLSFGFFEFGENYGFPGNGVARSDGREQSRDNEQHNNNAS